MFKVGLTGGIGSGKSFVAQIFKVLGIPVYHADDHARRMMNEDLHLKGKLVKLLGSEAYKDENLDRQYVASLIFKDSNLIEQINSLVHPIVRNDFTEWLKKKKCVPYVIEEAAILFESGAASGMDMTIVVDAPEHLRIKRVMQRDSVSESSVRDRIASQMDEKSRRKLADHVIVNDESELILPQVITLHKQILLKAK